MYNAVDLRLSLDNAKFLENILLKSTTCYPLLYNRGQFASHYMYTCIRGHLSKVHTLVLHFNIT